MAAHNNPKLERKINEARQAVADKGVEAIDPKILFGRVSVEDLELYTPDMLARVAALAKAEVSGFDGKARISLVQLDDVRPDGRAATILSVTDRNMPFLYDSVMGEIAATHREILFAMHPILVVRPDMAIALFTPGLDCPPDRRISHIQIHLPALSPDQSEAVAARIRYVLDQVHAAVGDWRMMLARLDAATNALEAVPATSRRPERLEAIAFLRWLADNNFTFLGMREYVYSGEGSSAKVERAKEDGIGILADPDIRVLRQGKDHVTTTPEILAFLEGPDSLIVTKANMRSVVHRRAYMDYVGVKMFDENGRISGELRVVGLFTSGAYTRSVRDIPLLRMKVDSVVRKLGFDREGHSGKMLLNTLESYPRDDLFQIEPDLLAAFCAQISELGDRPRVRVLPRIDRFDRFVSVIVFVPRDQYNSEAREKIGLALADRFDGHVSAYYPAFPEGNVARVHFIIGRAGGKTPRIPQGRLEQEIRRIVTRWEDRFELEKRPEDPALIVSQAYREHYDPGAALADLPDIVAASAPGTIRIAMAADHTDTDARGRLIVKIFHANEPVALSRRVPLLENLGFHVISEQTFEIGVAEGDGTTRQVVLHEMEMTPSFVGGVDLNSRVAALEAAFMEIWDRRVDDDRYNQLVATAGLAVEQAVVLRAYGRYLRQLGSTYSQGYIAQTLNRHAHIAAKLYALFETRFRLDLSPEQRDRQMSSLRKSIETALADVSSLEEDRVLRRYQSVVMATLRTNYFQRDAAGRRNPSLAFKLNPRLLDGIPLPKPYREIFVYGARVEGLHLRFGPVARGGLRWSDRPEDYRTEVLGLVKAQQVKNAVIVPVGSKGGFFPKQLPAGGNRDAIFEEGREAYKVFIATLLSVTDNIVDAEVVPPADTVRHDGDDPYFVVAADKGTATFSDTANAISQAHGFWLDDAFASGGSAGYDHKKMGITARGAWEAVKRHFREMDIDIQSSEFTVAGVGDMSGDVFGNGMLLSKKIRLVAAFDHRDIFIDPLPDCATSLRERKRLFDLGRSSWQDYDRRALSEGGMIIPRSEKSVKLTRQTADALGLAPASYAPQDIMTAILKAPVDLMWFGGIGTYIKAADENDAEVGDRANDAIRVTAGEVRARVIGEGANLGVTQKGRIAYGLKGGRCNSDAIDNSAGVNSSDVEVNIKIALASAMRDGRLTRDDRNAYLESMTEEVAALVLRNNYLQSLAISLVERRGDKVGSELDRMMIRLENDGKLDRKVETLPDSAALAERYAAGKPLTRAEIGVLLSYAKIILFDDLAASSLSDDPYLERTLLSYFPRPMQGDFRGDIENHRLRREIISTMLANDAINRGGPSFVSSIVDATGALPADIVKCFVLARDGLELNALYDQVDALDAKVPGLLQNSLYAALGDTVRSVSHWAIGASAYMTPLDKAVTELQTASGQLRSLLPSLVSADLRRDNDRELATLQDAGVPQKLAHAIVSLPLTALIPELVQISRVCKRELTHVATQYFTVTETFRIGRIEAAARRVDTTDHYDALAVARNLDEISVARRTITMAALSRYGDEKDPIAAWVDNDKRRIGRVRAQILGLTESGDINVARLTVAAGMMADLARGDT